MENEIKAPQDPGSAQPPVAPDSKRNLIVGSVLGLVVLAALAAGAYFMSKHAPSTSNNQTANTQTPTPTPTDVPPPGTGPYVRDDLFKDLGKNYSYAEPKVSGVVTWHYPTKISALDIYAANPSDSLKSELGNQFFYELGTFNSGKYQGYKLDLASLECDGPCGPANLRIAYKAGSKPVVLGKYSDDPANAMAGLLDTNKYTTDKTFDLSDLNYPNSLTGPKSNQTLARVTTFNFQSQDYNPFDASNISLVFTDPTYGPVFTDKTDSLTQGANVKNGFYMKAPDWSSVVYKYTPNFITGDNVPTIKWSDNSQNKDTFTYQYIGGCGATNYANVVNSQDVKMADLVQTGTTSQGDPIYEFKDTNNQMLKDEYANQYNPFDPKTYQPDPAAKIPYAQYVTKHPIIFWMDPFGRMIEFENNTYKIIMAECAKPVIYLYPKQTEKVRVELAPTGGFTYTEPAYANGWEVTAQPNGELTTIDGKIYPYLFWEGRSKDIYETPDRGFVVAQKDLHAFLNDKLGQLGLNKQEKSDFEAYWEPLMNDKPYYFVTFMGNSFVDKIAPLTVTPTPDTVIRILMDYRGLDKPVTVQGYNISTPKRTGFTVVEWGGVKH